MIIRLITASTYGAAAPAGCSRETAGRLCRWPGRSKSCGALMDAEKIGHRPAEAHLPRIDLREKLGVTTGGRR